MTDNKNLPSNNKNISKTAMLTISAVFAALIAVCSQIAIPLPVGVPITLQTFAVTLCGFTLPVTYALASIGTYILLGTVGVPVFSSFGAGIGVLLGKTGGFIFGFIFLVLCSSLSEKADRKWLRIVLSLFGLIICHLIGIGQFAFITGTDFFKASLAVSLPFLFKDTVSVIAAFFLSVKLKSIMAKHLQK